MGAANSVSQSQHGEGGGQPDPETGVVGQARAAFARVLILRDKGELEEANRVLTQASAYWTRATWKEYVEDYVSKRDDVEPYREMPDEGV